MEPRLTMKINFLISLTTASALGIILLAVGRPSLGLRYWYEGTEVIFAASVIGTIAICIASIFYIFSQITDSKYYRAMILGVAICTGSALLCFTIAAGMSWKDGRPLFEAWVLAASCACFEALLMSTSLFFTDKVPHK
ncbi:hypothetical protein EG68_01818 [Paragonimus skrjabini miyazakii]|uniref:Uncharacterized protein n=1 Tax=Paragonimus skrjabini miyazakii TaxID=59628 RepID=A0A8S9ZA07_9TREM|nr:hypothetical protein EG68_01818 [Paragonimus skrjabini miyazakii]